MLECFDALIMGLAATLSGHIHVWFQQNVVSEYAHAEVVHDRVNVTVWVVQIRTKGLCTGNQGLKRNQVREASARLNCPWHHGQDARGSSLY
jgi:type I site-specific restriction endonuclease